jgi:LL-diaminopimelate aminotransferase
MATINSNYDKLTSGYLFPEITKRVNAYIKINKSAELMRLGIGNTTEPLPPTIIK